MQTRKRRYWGMTGTQLIILGCLGLTALGAMGFMGWVILGNSPLQNIPAAQPNSGPLQTFTPQPTLTLRPTRTPILPTFTFTPTTYESLIPEGWNQYKYNKVEVWIPQDFVKDPSGKALINVIDGNPTNNGFKSFINLIREDGISGDLETYVTDSLGHFSVETTFLERKSFPISSYEAIRVKLQVIILGINAEEAVYLVKDSSTVWILTCATYYDEFRDRLPTFDQIARTFRIDN
jgi:hypothetical protein